MQKDSRIFIAGHRGLVGSAIYQELRLQGYQNVLVCGREEVDLADPVAVSRWFTQHRPEFVILAAAKVGGIQANRDFPVDFLLENLKIQQSVIEASYKAEVQRLLFLASSSIYPRLCPQPMREEYLLSGKLEPTNRPYSIAKIAGVELCWAYNRQFGTRYLVAMPTNLYGPGDNFDPQSSHVLPGLIRRLAEASRQGLPTVEVWGSGTPRRELMFSTDCAIACIFLLNLPEEELAGLLPQGMPPIINVGTGEDVTIRELAELVAREVGYKGNILFDATRPDGPPRKLLDVSRLRALGWRSATSLQEGIHHTYEYYLHNYIQPST